MWLCLWDLWWWRWLISSVRIWYILWWVWLRWMNCCRGGSKAGAWRRFTASLGRGRRSWCICLWWWVRCWLSMVVVRVSVCILILKVCFVCSGWFRLLRDLIWIFRRCWITWRTLRRITSNIRVNFCLLL